MAILKIDWADKQTKLVEWVEASTGRKCFWRDQAQFVGYADPYFLLHISNIEQLGQPSITYDFSSILGLLVPKVFHLLRVTIETSCVCSDQTPGVLSTQELAALKLRGALPINKKILLDSRIGFALTTPALSVSFESQGRRLSQATCDFVFHIEDVYQDDAMTETYLQQMTGDANTFDTEFDVDVSPKAP